LQSILIWWLLIQLLGLIALPLAYRLFKWLPGRGYVFAKPLGLLLTSYTLWLGGSLGFLHNTVGGILVAIALTGGISLWFYDRHGDEADQPLVTFLRGRKGLILTVEALFTVTFIVWCVLRAYAADKIMSSGGEKFMEIAFLNAILRSRQFPPLDPWLSGFAISYYYFGYVMIALLTKLSGVASGVGFELYDALLFALTATGAFGVVYNLIAGRDHPSSNGPRSLRYGLLGSLFVVVMGNLEGLLEAAYAKGILPEAFWRWIDIPDLMESASVTGSWYPGHGWWWWRASRVIRDRDLLGRPMGISPIDEFPLFSFLLGDNHPHVLALPFVLLATALALNLLRKEMGKQGNRETRMQEKIRLANLHLADLWTHDWAFFLTYAVILGALGFLNTWDFPIYLGLTVLAYGAGRFVTATETARGTLQRMIALGVGLLVAGILLYLPFYVSFQSQAGGVLPYLLPPTRLPQYLVMFGPFIFITAWFLAVQLLRQVGRGSKGSLLNSIAQWWGLVMLIPIALLALLVLAALLTPQGRQFIQGVLANPEVQQVVGGARLIAALKAIVMARLRTPWLHPTLSLLIALGTASLLRRPDERKPDDPLASDRFATLLIIVGLALSFSVEFVYLRDHFGVRMNTVFKFYYQTWVMLGCASAYGVWRVLSGRESSTLTKALFRVGAVVLIAAAMVYPLMASYSRVRGFQTEPNLNGAINIARNHPDDWAAIEWLRDNAEGTPVILEAPGGSYEYEGRISAFTGFPAVLGWALHESQWRGNYVEQGKREPDIAMIYTTPSGEQALKLLHKWDVDYVVIGTPERRYVEQLCSASERQCTSREALRKFDRVLEPVFEQGQTTIYRVPEA